jgi:rhomboid protease GluP
MAGSDPLLDRLLRALGLDPVRLRWRWQRLRGRAGRASRSLENRTRALRYPHKVCAACGTTVAAEERRCPHCGARLGSRLGVRARQLLRLAVPEGTYTVTAVMVIACVAFFLAMIMRSGGLGALTRGVAPAVMIRFGAWTVPLVLEGELHRLVTPIFLHFDLLHLIFNALWLVQLGPLVEETYGRSRTTVIVLATGVAGFATSVLYRLEAYRALPVPGAGASGVVFGLIGLAIVAALRHRMRVELRSGLVKWALYGIVFSLLPGVDLAAHLGGAVAGAALGAALGVARGRTPLVWRLLEILALSTIVLSYTLAALRPAVG